MRPYLDPASLPKHYDASSREAYHRQQWEQNGTYRYNPDHGRNEAFVVDTPPPTVSGSLHVGHVFSYTQADVVVRYQRMTGRRVFYPMGWDDNGLPTERRVQNYFHVRCDPSLEYEPRLELPMATGKAFKERPRPVSRRNFIELCQIVTAQDERAFQELWQRIGLSVDWSQEYATIDERSRALSQYSFLDLYEKGHLYNSEAPTMWDVDFQSAVAQAEIEDRPTQGHYHDIEFGVADSERTFVISTTRPELLPACVGITAHPDDTRFAGLFGAKAVTPLFHSHVPIFPSQAADPEKGTGILMVCTFGDATDVQWWQEQGLELRQAVDRSGRLLPVQFGGEGWQSEDAESANRAYAELAGKNLKQARAAIVELLSAPESAPSGGGSALQGAPRPIEHVVRYYEQGDRPLEFVTSRQWFVRLTDKKRELIARGREIEWHPEYMLTRFIDWTENLQLDWCISRQRYFGVPFPVWYPVDDTGETDFASPIVADAAALPVDPLSDVPAGYRAEQRDQPGGFTAEADVLDTWFTSSLTPQIGSGWVRDPARHDKLFPTDLRPQAHDIIRTWAFYTIAKSHLHHGTAPWRHAFISGFILDPDRKKMSKSKGNTVTPQDIIETNYADATRYWASSARLGVDTAYDEGMFKIGRRLVTKLYNAGKFVRGITDDLERDSGPGAGGSRLGPEAITEELDRGFVDHLRQLAATATRAFESFDYATALHQVEDFFWTNFTDSYLELAKNRAKGEGDVSDDARVSACATLHLGLDILTRLFAPFLPFIAEELWSWRPEAQGDSVHTASWPSVEELAVVPPPISAASFDAAKASLAAIHRHKTQAAVSVARELATIELAANPATIRSAEEITADVISAVRAHSFELVEDDQIEEGDFEVRSAKFAAQA